MGRKKYYNGNSNKNTEKQNAILGILFIISLFVYLNVIRDIMTEIQWDLFCNSKTVLLMTSSFWVGLIEILSGPSFIITIFVCLYYKVKQLKSSKNYEKSMHQYSKYIKLNIVASVVSFALILISFFSYCRADIDGLYVRDIRTSFKERRYSWDEVRSVEINYHRIKGGDYNLQYFLNLDGFTIDVQDAYLTSRLELLDNGQKEIHRIIKENDIPIYKNIKKHNNEIKEFLNLIGENEG